MKMQPLLRRISFVMLVVAVVFVFCALSNPALGRTIYIGSFAFGAEQWRVCYAIYALVMAGLFLSSFFVKNQEGSYE